MLNISFKERQKLENALKEVKVKCPCGHTVEVYHDKRICTNCGNYVFKNKDEEFKYRLKEKMNKSDK